MVMGERIKRTPGTRWAGEVQDTDAAHPDDEGTEAAATPVPNSATRRTGRRRPPRRDGCPPFLNRHSHPVIPPRQSDRLPGTTSGGRCRAPGDRSGSRFVPIAVIAHTPILENTSEHP